VLSWLSKLDRSQLMSRSHRIAEVAAAAAAVASAAPESTRRWASSLDGQFRWVAKRKGKEGGGEKRLHRPPPSWCKT